MRHDMRRCVAIRLRQSWPTLAIVSAVNSVTTPVKSRRHSPVIIVALMGLFCCVWPKLSAANPLTISEQTAAERIALQQPWRKPHSASTNPHHALTQQTLSVEPDVRKHKGHAKQVWVYQFNYHTASARMLVVSLTTHTVIRESAIKSPHLPLNKHESNAALTTLAANTEAMELLRADQIRRGQKPFNKLNELSVKSSVFAPIDVEHPCAVQRCALLSLFDQGNTVFAMEPVINLQHGTLGWLNR